MCCHGRICADMLQYVLTCYNMCWHVTIYADMLQYVLTCYNMCHKDNYYVTKRTPYQHVTKWAAFAQFYGVRDFLWLGSKVENLITLLPKINTTPLPQDFVQ